MTQVSGGKRAYQGNNHCLVAMFLFLQTFQLPATSGGRAMVNRPLIQPCITSHILCPYFFASVFLKGTALSVFTNYAQSRLTTWRKLGLLLLYISGTMSWLHRGFKIKKAVTMVSFCISSLNLYCHIFFTLITLKLRGSY